MALSGKAAKSHPVRQSFCTRLQLILSMMYSQKKWTGPLFQPLKRNFIGGGVGLAINFIAEGKLAARPKEAPLGPRPEPVCSNLSGRYT